MNGRLCSGQAPTKQVGAVLLESLIAILIFSMGILAVVGLQATAIKATSDAKYRVDASFLANQVVGRMWSNTANLAGFVETDTPVDALPQGKRTVAVNGTTVTITVTWQVPGEDATHSFVEVVRINGNI